MHECQEPRLHGQIDEGIIQEESIYVLLFYTQRLKYFYKRFSSLTMVF